MSNHTDYLALFQQQQRGSSRISPDPEAIRRWEFEARWRGATAIKKQLAGAKRQATMLRASKEQFTHLRAEHELALNAAAGALRALVVELEVLSKWAAEYHAFFCRTRSAQEEAELDAFAQARWGDDGQALQFEAALMTELGTQDGRLAFASWVQSTGNYAGLKLENIHCPVERLESPSRTHDYEPKLATLRARAAWTVRKTQSERERPLTWGGNGGRDLSVCCGWSEYEAYLTFRKGVAIAAERVVNAASAGVAS